MKINEPISVSFAYDADKRQSFPKWLIWSGRLRPVTRVGLHHKFRKGKILFHVFSVTSRGSFFRLILNTENLQWEVEQISESLNS